jgi:DNA-binding NarL/FixJ family response regulator
MASVRVVLADDHPIVRAGIRDLLSSAPDIAVVGEAGDGRGALQRVAELAPDVLLLDMELPDQTGIDVMRALKESGAAVRVLALSAYDDEQYIRGVLSHGAAGYITKEEALDTIVEAVRGAARGEEGWLSRRAAARMAEWSRRIDQPGNQALTPRETEVLRLLGRGWSNDEIARELTISERTVRFHLTNAYDKLGLGSRSQAIAWALKQHLD